VDITIIVLAALLVNTYQHFYFKSAFRKGKLTVPFLNNIAKTIEQYPDSYLPSHKISLDLLYIKIIPTIEEFIKSERTFTTLNRQIWLLNAWILFGFYYDIVIDVFFYYFTIGLFTTINIDLITQQFKVYNKVNYMKRACAQYTEYMHRREDAKVAIDEFLEKIDDMIESIPDDNKNNGSPNERSD